MNQSPGICGISTDIAQAVPPGFPAVRCYNTPVQGSACWDLRNKPANFCDNLQRTEPLPTIAV